MKNYIFYVPGGGIFSRIFQFAILRLADIDFDNVYLIPAGFAEPDDPNDEFCRKCYDICLNNVNLMNKYGIEDPYEHCFNYVLDQKRDDSYELKGYLSMGPRFDKENKLEDSDKLQLYKKVLDKTLSGQVDHYKDGVITDYKVTTSFKVCKGDYSDWEKQLNIYAWLFKQHKYKVNSLRIISFIRDHSESNKFKSGYPNFPITVIPITLWEDHVAESFIKDKEKY